MTKKSLAVVILAAGQGTRMGTPLPKVLHQVAHRPMILHVLDQAQQLNPEKVVVVLGHEAEQVKEALPSSIQYAYQTKRKGTANAVEAALPLLEDFEGDILILYGDTPLITFDSLQKLQTRFHDTDCDLALLGFRTEKPFGYGRLIIQDDHLTAIVEEKEADDAQKKIKLCNGGMMIVKAERLRTLLPQIDCNNAKGEYYLTDLVGLVDQISGRACYVNAPIEEVLGVNTLPELAEAESVMQERLGVKAMKKGVIIQDPKSTYMAADTEWEGDAFIEPNVYIGPGVTIGKCVTIKAFSYLEGAMIGADVTIGPFARIRPESKIGKSAKIGNFVEVKKSDIGEGVKINHLSYIGDATIGEASNVGAGTITCNYDGVKKHPTKIGKKVFIGSNAALIAPVTIGDDAMIAAGSVVSDDVAPGELAVTRADEERYQSVDDYRATRKKRRSAS